MLMHVNVYPYIMSHIYVRTKHDLSLNYEIYPGIMFPNQMRKCFVAFLLIYVSNDDPLW